MSLRRASTVPQVVRDRRVDVGQIERRVLHHDLLGRTPVSKGDNQRVERYAGRAYADDRVSVASQWSRMGGQRIEQAHGSHSSIEDLHRRR